MSASGGKVSLFNMMTFKVQTWCTCFCGLNNWTWWHPFEFYKFDHYMISLQVMTTFMPPPPAATFLAFHPQDNNIIAIGMEDSSIQIYNVRIDEVSIINFMFPSFLWYIIINYFIFCVGENKTQRSPKENHRTSIFPVHECFGFFWSWCTGNWLPSRSNFQLSSMMRLLTLATYLFQQLQLCVWSIDGWEKKKARFIQPPVSRSGQLIGDTKVQFHNDQTHLLIVHESQLSIYDSKLECLRSVSFWPFAFFSNSMSQTAGA